jgi:hypothetical protein
MGSEKDIQMEFWMQEKYRRFAEAMMDELWAYYCFALFRNYTTAGLYRLPIFQRGIFQNIPSAFEQYRVHLNKPNNRCGVFADDILQNAKRDHDLWHP